MKSRARSAPAGAVTAFPMSLISNPRPFAAQEGDPRCWTGIFESTLAQSKLQKFAIWLVCSALRSDYRVFLLLPHDRLTMWGGMGPCLMCART